MIRRLLAVTLLWAVLLGLVLEITAPAHAADAPTPLPPAAGTTIVGEKEAATGLYLLPWKRARPDPALDRPPLLHDEDYARSSAAANRQQLDTADALADRRRTHFEQYP